VAAEGQLEWEARTARPAAAAAVGSALALLVSTVAQIILARQGARGDAADSLRLVHDHSTGFLASTGLLVVSYLLLGGALYYLFGATRARRSQLPAVAVHLIYIAPILIAVSALITQLDRIDAADAFVSGGAETAKRAKDLVEQPSGLALGLGLGSGLALALSLVLINVNAMRAGLLTRFLGTVGAIIGALYVLPLAPGVSGIVQIFWLGALAAVFVDRYPGGRGKAWDTGKAERWPSRAELASAQAKAERAEAEDAEPEAEAEAEPKPRPASRKRRRKQR